MVSKGLKVNALYLELSYGITMSEGSRVDLLNKAGNHRGYVKQMFKG